MSKRRQWESRVYRERRLKFLAVNPRCFVFPNLKATQVHHIRGRSGTLYLDERYWLAVSMAGHQWIQDHPDEARKIGALCEKGKWGSSE